MQAFVCTLVICSCSFILLFFNISSSSADTTCVINIKVTLKQDFPPLRLDNAEERGFFLEGDMIIPNARQSNSAQDGSSSSSSFSSSSSNSISTSISSTLWPNAVMFYTMDGNFTAGEVRLIKQAFESISLKSCVHFVERNSEIDYVFIQRGMRNSGCYSFVGRVGGRQILNVEIPVCPLGSIIHEILHSLGRLHEQSRFDRDDHVLINYANIIPGAERNFQKYSELELPTYGVPYDLSSIMHYSPYAFAQDPNLPTIVPRDGGNNQGIGQRIGLSPRDVEKINRIYNCL